MTSAEFKEALELTLGGMGTAFLLLAILIALILGMKWISSTRVVQRRTGALAAARKSAASRERALAAAIAVSAALAEGEVTGRHNVQEDTSGATD
ncbi:MAG: OadG family transporter subunit [Candidatus Methylomirabilia bacterium]